MPIKPVQIIASAPADPDEYLPFLALPVAPLITECSFDLAVALAAKGFVIITGQSGTGKSRSAIELGQALNGLEDYGERGLPYEFVPVGADWVDSRPLLGYMNPFGKARQRSDGTTSNETYEIPSSLQLILRAAAPANAAFPMIVILDEMNLSHVERYFSAFLSLIEANRSSPSESDIQLIPLEKILLIAEVLKTDQPNSPVTKAAEELVAEGTGLPVPSNLLIVGTVNVDETTYMFSPKVLDRAHVLELRSVPPGDYLSKSTKARTTLSAKQALRLLQWSIEQRRDGAFDQHPDNLINYAISELNVAQPEANEIRSITERLLAGAFKLLDPVGFGFGFRVINEVFAYLLCWLKAKSLDAPTLLPFWADWEDALDIAFLQKVLPKLHGNRRQLGESLDALAVFLSGGDENSNPAAKYRIGDAAPVVIGPAEKVSMGRADQMNRSRQKLERMRQQLRATGHTTFIQ